MKLSEAVRKIQKSNIADPRWLPFNNHDVIIKSYALITSHCRSQRNIFGHTTFPPSLIAIAFILAKLWRQGRNGVRGGGGGSKGEEGLKSRSFERKV